MYDDVYLRAATEEEMIAALPGFRDGDRWRDTDGQGAALDIIGPLWLAPPEVVGGAPTVDARFHANLRLPLGHPDREAILAEVAPHTITPAEPRRRWA